MENKNEKIEIKNETQKIEIERDQYEKFLTENASLKKELELLKNRNIDQDVITVSSVEKPTNETKKEKKGVL